MTQEDWEPRRAESGSAFVGVLLLLVGAWQVFVGTAVVCGDAFVFTGGGYWFRADNTGWGWVNLGIGLAAIAVALGQLGSVRRLTRLGTHASPALLVAVVSAMNQFFLSPQYPLWASLVIAVDVFVIWALTTRARPGDEERDRMGR